ncbi:MAG: FeoB-associated Cys-rich membrane protein [Gemmatimonadetes bacterium]|nr:FeoB-associated Cys-rich membrane protein [Gemmatimonadota bacterium]
MDSQTLQTIIVALIIGAAALFVGRKFYRTFAAARKPKGSGCGSDCGCGPAE